MTTADTTDPLTEACQQIVHVVLERSDYEGGEDYLEGATARLLIQAVAAMVAEAALREDDRSAAAFASGKVQEIFNPAALATRLGLRERAVTVNFARIKYRLQSALDALVGVDAAG